MKKIFTFLFVCSVASVVLAQTPCVNGMAGIYPCNNVDLMSIITLQQLGASENTNDVWGWTSPYTNREYALVGCNNGTSFMDITDPVNPVKIGFLPTHTTNSLWRDIETQGNYAFIVSEASYHGLQIFDLTQLDNVVNPPQTFSETAHYNSFGHAHTVSINPDKPYAYCVGTGTMSGGLHIVDISDPLNPQIAGGFSLDGYTHDCQAVIYHGPDEDYEGREIVMACNEDALTLVDVTDKTDCNLISSKTYPQTGYVHQGWLTEDHRYFILDDELDEDDYGGNTRTHIFDVQDLDHVVYKGYHLGATPSIDHNQYINDHFVYQSNYTSGLRILDEIKVADAELTEVGFFDLYPSNNNVQYAGSWGNYPWFKSGNVVATNMYGGLAVVHPNLVVLSENSFSICGDDQITFNLTVNAGLQFPLTVDIEGIPGTIILASPTVTAPGTVQVTMGNLSSIPLGFYEGKVTLNTTFGQAYHFPVSFDIQGYAAVIPSLIVPTDGILISNTSTSYDFSWLPVPDAVSYTFELSDDALFSNLISQQTLNTAVVTIDSDLADGTYYWRVRSTNICGESPWSDVRSFIVQVVGIDEIRKNEISVYPNPASDQLIISFTNTIGGRMDILDITGRTIESLRLNGTKQAILDVSPYSTGVYFIRIGSSITRFVKK